MNFADFRFWQLCFSGLGGIFLLKLLFPKAGPSLDKSLLLLLGLFLLYAASPESCIIFILISTGSYLGIRWLVARPRNHQNWYLLIFIPLQLLPLLYYKYGHFLSHEVLGLPVLKPLLNFGDATSQGAASLQNLIIPAGISFYTFQKIAFVLDTLAFRKPVPAFLDYFNFSAFFPQVVAGPIERRHDLLPQIEQFRFRWSREAIDEGATWIVLGLFFKLVLADNFAIAFNSVEYLADAQLNVYHIWAANLLFGLRIYYDFAGYSLVALGLARCLGIRLTLNFASPYCATSCAEFWRRWHITLSQWFRDYLYIPSGGGRVRWWMFNILTVFILSGIWHGAGWNFMLWGALHGLCLIINRLWGKRIALPAVVGWFMTMSVCFLAWLCFYELNTATLFRKLEVIFTPDAYRFSALREALSLWTSTDLAFSLCFLTLGGAVLCMEWLSIRWKKEPYALLWNRGALVVLIIVLAPGINNGFIYFAF